MAFGVVETIVGCASPRHRSGGRCGLGRILRNFRKNHLAGLKREPLPQRADVNGLGLAAHQITFGGAEFRGRTSDNAKRTDVEIRPELTVDTQEHMVRLKGRVMPALSL